MGLWNKLKGELIDIIEWPSQDDYTIVWRFERYGNEIKNGAKLVVREGQVAVFVNEGEMADVFPPGTYTLETKNLPILSTLQGWKYGFNSPFKAEVYFISTRVFTNMKWGTPNAFYVRDPEYGQVSLRAFGTFSFQVNEAPKFFKKFVGARPDLTTDDIIGELRSNIITSFISAIGGSGLALADYSTNYKKLSDIIEEKLQAEFAEYGLRLHKFLISSINLPEELQKRFNERAGMNMLGDMAKYQQFKMAEAMGDAARGGNVSGGVEGMMGLAMMQMMMNQQAGARSNPSAGPGMPPPPMSQYYVAQDGQQLGPFTMEQLQQMAASGQLTPQTYVWKQGLPNWMPASQVPELGQLFGATPPPPPPPGN